MVGHKASGGGMSEIDMLFPDQRELGDTTLRQCQLVMVRMLRVFDHICTRENISYWLTAGTLIGALRHRAMIPWDCDIDVAMTEEDRQAFVRCADKLPADMFLQTPQTDPYYSSTRAFKLRDRHSNYYEWKQKNPHARWHNGLQVDLIAYPRDEAGNLINPYRSTVYRQDEIFPLERIEFEGSMLLAPTNPDRYIRRRYGNYRKLPPFWRRKPHEGKADPFQPCGHPESRAYRRRSADDAGDR